MKTSKIEKEFYVKLFYNKKNILEYSKKISIIFRMDGFSNLYLA